MAEVEPVVVVDMPEAGAPPGPPDKTPRYAVGQRVRIAGLDEPMEVVDLDVYGPTAQYYMVRHPDPNWQPPGDTKLVVNRNYGPPRLGVDLRQILGLVA